MKDLDDIKIDICKLFERDDIEFGGCGSRQTMFFVQGTPRSIYKVLLKKTDSTHWSLDDGGMFFYKNTEQDLMLAMRKASGMTLVIGSVASLMTKFIEAVQRGDDPETWPQ